MTAPSCPSPRKAYALLIKPENDSKPSLLYKSRENQKNKFYLPFVVPFSPFHSLDWFHCQRPDFIRWSTSRFFVGSFWLSSSLHRWRTDVFCRIISLVFCDKHSSLLLYLQPPVWSGRMLCPHILLPHHSKVFSQKTISCDWHPIGSSRNRRLYLWTIYSTTP